MPPEIADFVRAAAPSFVAGMLALTTALVIFGFQQRAARRVARDAKLDQAFEHVMDGFRAVQDGVLDTSRVRTPDDLADSLERFAWLLPKRDQIVAVWVSLKANQVMTVLQKVQDTDQRRIEIGSLKGEVAMTLRAWRARWIRRRWFMDRCILLSKELGIPLEEMGIADRPGRNAKST